MPRRNLRRDGLNRPLHKPLLPARCLAFRNVPVRIGDGVERPIIVAHKFILIRKDAVNRCRKQGRHYGELAVRDFPVSNRASSWRREYRS